MPKPALRAPGGREPDPSCTRALKDQLGPGPLRRVCAASSYRPNGAEEVFRIPWRKCPGALCLETFLDPQVSRALPLSRGHSPSTILAHDFTFIFFFPGDVVLRAVNCRIGRGLFPRRHRYWGVNWRLFRPGRSRLLGGVFWVFQEAPDTEAAVWAPDFPSQVPRGPTGKLMKDGRQERPHPKGTRLGADQGHWPGSPCL